jgi:membrane-associated phospholipid phosphatase
MNWFFSSLIRNLAGCFRGRMIWWHALAIVLTVVLVRSGFDWKYFCETRAPWIRSAAWPAIRLGTQLPFILPLGLLATGIIFKRVKCLRMAAAVAQAAILGSLISSTYKAFTGRAHPLHEIGKDISRDFLFGFWRGGIFWGWPSSHTTIAFAMGVTLYMLLPRQRWAGWLAIVYSFYVGLAVSVTIHWFSDFVAGGIIGTVIGVIVGRSFLGADSTGGIEIANQAPQRDQG